MTYGAENLLDVFTVLGLVADFLLPLWWGPGRHHPVLLSLVGRLPHEWF